MTEISKPCPTLVQIKNETAFLREKYPDRIFCSISRELMESILAEVSALQEPCEEECEWQYKHYPNLGAGEWVTSCGYFMGPHAYKFCPYCGKKIKRSEAHDE